ncbi:MAG: hypothetical protein ACKOFB_07730, partial [bacterium]
MMISLLLCSILFASTVLHAEGPFVTKGKATILSNDISPGCQGSRPAALGSFQGPNGSTILVPAETKFINGKRFHDFYNQCASVTPTSMSQVKIESMEITTIDPDGEVITGYILCD